MQEIDGASNTGVDSIRELREMTRFSPARDRFRIWIIDEVHQISGAAFNALLKTLEEPPPRVKFIFATTEYHKIPETILSRCQQFDFRMISAREQQQHLRHVADAEKIRVSDAALGLVARAAEGSVRDALSLFDQVLAFSGDEVKDEDVAGLLGLVDRELLLPRLARDRGGRKPRDARAGREPGRLRRGLPQLPARAAAASARDPAREARSAGEPAARGHPARGGGAAARARGGAVAGGPAARPRPLDRGRERVPERHRPARGARPRAAEAGRDAEAHALRRARGPRGAAARRRPGRGARPRGAARAAGAASESRAAPPSPPAAPAASGMRPAPAPRPKSRRAWWRRQARRLGSRRGAARLDAGPLPGAADARRAAPRARASDSKATRSCSSCRPISRCWRRARRRLQGARGEGRRQERPAPVRRQGGARLAAAAVAASPEVARKQQLREEAEKEPAVQEALDLFDGRVVDVREAKPGREDA